ncbi:uncharacterized protein LOC124427497 [Vespa crabro]|uniref:uncharacterized protein LOC124427497 n=1 Tax=Vespa crabro TaxID=7445 RepID=UPI001F02530F|nr:uncharacterized protein LOC124427497 [Vespa crabro]
MWTVNRLMADNGQLLALENIGNVGYIAVESKSAIKYLGIMIYRRLNFGAQIQQTSDKSAKRITFLSRLMGNVTGSNASKRRLLMIAVQSVLLYGAKVWADLLSKESYQDRMAQVQKRATLRIVFAYRTVFESAILTIKEVIPIALLAQESKAVHLRKIEVEKAVTSKD